MENVINQKNSHHEATQQWKAMVFELFDRLKKVEKTNDEKKIEFSNNRRQKVVSDVNRRENWKTELQIKQPNIDYLEISRYRCENLVFY